MRACERLKHGLKSVCRTVTGVSALVKGGTVCANFVVDSRH